MLTRMRPTSREILTNAAGEKIYVERFKCSASAQSIVLLNGSAFNHKQWDVLLKFLLSSKYNLVRYDYVGTGCSSAVARTWSINGLVSELLFILDSLQLEKVHLYGLSKGTIVGQFFAASFPQRVFSLAGYGFYNPIFSDLRSIQARFERRIKRFELLTPTWELPLNRRRFAQLWKAVYAEVFYRRPYERLSFLNKLRDFLVQLKIYPLLAPTAPKRMYDWFSYALKARDELGQDYKARVEVLKKLPILIQHASHDDTLPIAMAHELQVALPHARLIEYPKPFGHVTPALLADQAESLIGDYVRFLEGL